MSDNENKPVDPIEQELPAEETPAANPIDERKDAEEQETSPPHAPDTETNRKSLINWTWIGVTLLALAALILVLVLG
ncbi:MAG: hypothetical protein JWR03_2520, partial [Cohnella sp.]|nr:hypothetical protein [Cohnella sp.]